MEMESEAWLIRPAGQADADAMAQLFGQLGYPASPTEVGERWGRQEPASEVLLACDGNDVAGVLVWHRLRPLHVAPDWGLISALVVDEGARGAGVGAALLAAAEASALAQGCSQLELSSSLKREGPIASIWRRAILNARNGS